MSPYKGWGVRCPGEREPWLPRGLACALQGAVCLPLFSHALGLIACIGPGRSPACFLATVFGALPWACPFHGSICNQQYMLCNNKCHAQPANHCLPACPAVDIPAGSLICTYEGEIVTSEEGVSTAATMPAQHACIAAQAAQAAIHPRSNSTLCQL